MTFTIRVRGAGGPMLAEYRCPRHGVFERVVARDANGDPPAFQLCHYYTGMTECSEPSPWTISAPAVHTQFVVTASRGRSDPKPHPNAMDTRALAEGRRKEWRTGRKKLREERRHARLKEYLR